MIRKSIRVLAISAAAATMATGAGVAFANAPGGPGGDRRGGGPGHGPGIADRHVLHGTFVRELADGSTETDDVQNGLVTAVSATSVTVQSSDDFTATYVIDEDTHINFCRNASDSDEIATGDRVSVLAVDDGNTATAQRIKDRGPADDGS